MRRQHIFHVLELPPLLLCDGVEWESDDSTGNTGNIILLWSGRCGDRLDATTLATEEHHVSLTWLARAQQTEWNDLAEILRWQCGKSRKPIWSQQAEWARRVASEWSEIRRNDHPDCTKQARRYRLARQQELTDAYGTDAILTFEILEDADLAICAAPETK